MLVNVFEKHSCKKARVSEMFSSLRKLLVVCSFWYEKSRILTMSRA